MFTTPLLIFFAAVIISSLGPILHIYGIPLSTAPWVLMYHLPLIKFALPNRFMQYAWLVLGILIALWLSSDSSNKKSIIKYFFVFLGLVSIFPNAKLYSNFSELHIPSIYSTKEICKPNQAERSLLIFPFGLSGNSMAYQIKSKMCFDMPEGYTGSVPYPFNLWNLVNILTVGNYNDINPKILAEYIATYHVYNVLVPDTINQLHSLEEKLRLAKMKKLYKRNTTIVYGRSRNFSAQPLTISQIIEYKRRFRKKWEEKNQENNRIIIAKISNDILIRKKYPENLYSWLISKGIAH